MESDRSLELENTGTLNQCKTTTTINHIDEEKEDQLLSMVVVRGRCRRDTIMMSERKEKDFFLFSTAYTNRIDCDSPYNKE
ncbi:hypothetical protein BLOT_005605 [Blomia tropicalis]|nr:hypothetical protein BLOT_005605 [Blomia tropicalis]